MNYVLPFNESEADKNLVANLAETKNIIEPFLARPEDDGYGVYAGRRRFLGALIAGFTVFENGKDFLIRNVTEAEARRASFNENSHRDDVNPIARAKALDEILKDVSLRAYSCEVGIPVSTLSEYHSLVKVPPKIQEVLSTGQMKVSDGIAFARLDPETQEELEKVLEKGKGAFNKAVKAAVSDYKEARGEKRARGAPRGNITHKLVWKKESIDETECGTKIEEAADAKGFPKPPDYLKDFLKNRLDEVQKDASE